MSETLGVVDADEESFHPLLDRVVLDLLLLLLLLLLLTAAPTHCPFENPMACQICVAGG
jgi:hypothetical protein